MEQSVPLPSPESALAPKIRALRARLPGRRRVVTILGGAAGVLLLIWLLLVHTPLAHPRDLEIKGATGATATKITAALEEAALEQSTFAVDEAALMQAVAGFPEVAAVRVSAHPPMRLDLFVVMRPAVATVEAGGRQVAVAADGTVLTRGVERTLPALDRSLGQITMRDGRVAGGAEALRLLAAAPEPLLGMAKALRQGRSGLELELTRGPRLIFGNADAAALKWAAAAAVIADGSAAQASYLDLRVPARPAVGGLGGSRAAGSIDPPALSAAGGAAAGAATITTEPLAPEPQATQDTAPAGTAPAPVAPTGQATQAPSASSGAPAPEAPASQAQAVGGAALSP